MEQFSMNCRLSDSLFTNEKDSTQQKMAFYLLLLVTPGYINLGSNDKRFPTYFRTIQCFTQVVKTGQCQMLDGRSHESQTHTYH